MEGMERGTGRTVTNKSNGKNAISFLKEKKLRGNYSHDIFFHHRFLLIASTCHELSKSFYFAVFKFIQFCV